jgi:hypothetical protein
MVGGLARLNPLSSVPGLALALTFLGCGGGVDGGANPDASNAGSALGEGGSSSNGCSASNPCVAGSGGCPSNSLPVPRSGDSCAEPGLDCYGYGSFSCGLTLICLANHTWQVTCPEHPFGLASGSCGCMNGGTTADGGSNEATACPSGVACGCSCPTSYDGGVCVCANFSMPECPLSVQSAPACEFAGPCMNCLGGAAGVICNCSDAGLQSTDGGGGRWRCLGTEQACTGGSFHF